MEKSMKSLRMKNQVPNTDQKKNRTMNTQKRKRSDEDSGAEIYDYDYEDDARLLRELKRRRADVEEDLNSHKKRAETMSKGINEIGRQLKEGTIRPERLEFKKRVYKDFLRFLPEVSEGIGKLKSEFDTCSTLIVEIEASLDERRRVLDSNPKFTATAAAAVVASEAE